MHRKVIGLFAAAMLAACDLFPSLDALTGACVETAPLDVDGGLPSWRVAGSARLRGDYAELTSASETQAGLLAWASNTDLTTATLTFDLSLTDEEATSGMGVAIGLLEGSAAAVPCVSDYDLCFLGGGVTGVAVIVRTAQRSGLAPQAPFVAVVDTSTDPKTPLADGTYASLPSSLVARLTSIDDSLAPPDSSWHAVAISIADGKVDVSLDGIAYLTGVHLPASAPTQGTWALGASTDQVGLGLLAHERAAVRNVKLVAPRCL